MSRAPLCLSLFFVALSLAAPAWAIDHYAVLEALTSKEKLPRLLNSDDLPDLQPWDPQPLLSPSGDFNADGAEDVAITGIYALASSNTRYFLLVGTQRKDPLRFARLTYQEYAKPVFIHRPGTTGEEDPGDQAFSISLCAHCQEGWDFYWDAKEKKFRRVKWIPNSKRLERKPAPPTLDVPPEVAEEALRIVASLKDVKEYVRTLEEEGRAFGVRAEAPTGAGPTDRTRVLIFEKKDGREILYDRIWVDVKGGRVISREMRPHLPD